jgi:hypothetical protein
MVRILSLTVSNYRVFQLKNVLGDVHFLRLALTEMTDFVFFMAGIVMFITTLPNVTCFGLTVSAKLPFY